MATVRLVWHATVTGGDMGAGAAECARGEMREEAEGELKFPLFSGNPTESLTCGFESLC